MSWTASLAEVRCLTDAEGRKPDVLVPLATWEMLLASGDRLVEIIEDEEDRATVKQWLAQEACGDVPTISLDELKRELTADGLLSD